MSRDSRCVCECSKTGLKQTRGAKSFRSIGKDSRTALSAKPDSARRRGRITRQCVAHVGRNCIAVREATKIAKVTFPLLSQHSDEMAQLLFDLAGGDNRVTNLLPQQKLVAVAETVESLPERILLHS